MDFPAVTVRDMVAVQAKLLEHLGISRLFAAIGGSMGGMQALAWAVDFPGTRPRLRSDCHLRFPQRHANCLQRNRPPRHHHRSELERRKLYSRPPAQARSGRGPHGRPRYLSERVRHDAQVRPHPATARPIRPSADEALFAVESYLHHQGESFVSRFDPNSYLYLTKALDQFDLFDGQPPEEVLRRVKARFLVISFASDWLYPPGQSRELVRLLKRSRVAATYINLESLYGHDSFFIENREFANVLRHYLDNEYRPRQFPPGRREQFNVAMHPGIYQRVLDWIPDGARVLDLGTGDGAFLERVVQARRVVAEGRGKES